MNYLPKWTQPVEEAHEAPLAAEGGAMTPVQSTNPFAAFDELMKVVEALNPGGAQRPTTVDRGKFLL
jgi:hypothetical protein